MDSMNRKIQTHNRWRDYGQCFCQFADENLMDWPVTSLQWGSVLQSNSEFVTQRLFFSCRTDGTYGSDNVWQGQPNMIIMSSIEIPHENNYFINELKSLYNPDMAKKHPNMKIKTVITHPGEVTVIRACPTNHKILASKNDINEVFIWSSDRYKTMTSSTNNPDLTIKTTKSDKANYALRFCPSLQRLISASGNLIELFDLEQSGPTKRQLGSVINSSSIMPSLTLTGHEGVEDIVFQSNEVWMSGGQDKQIGIWDYRMKTMVNKIKNIHEHDINCLSVHENIIISGGEEGRINVIDQRKLSVLTSLQTSKPVRSIGFNLKGNLFAAGNDKLSIFKTSEVVQNSNFEAAFTYYGLKGSINEFDWNHDFPDCIAATCQELQTENPIHGGVVHVFKPSSLFFQSQEDQIRMIEEAYGKLSPYQKQEVMNKHQ